MRTLVACLMHICLMLAARAAPARADLPDGKAEPTQAAEREKVLEWTSPQGKPFWYRLPKKLSESRPPNLILMLHGTGMPWGWAFFNYPIAAGKFRDADIVVAPEGMTPGNGQSFNFVQGAADGEQIVDLIRLFRKQFPIGRVYLYGHSQGAFFCYWFAGEHPELIDGIVAHAGNVLAVKHSKLARDKVAIGILHGRADAVVSVECAFRTEQVYRDEGYRKVKCYVVDGLTEQSGHWPLPGQVLEMLAWLDSVSVATVDGAIDAAIAGLARQPPDVQVLAESLASASALLKKAKAADAAVATERLAALTALLDAVAAAQAQALLADPALLDRALPYGPWVARFRRVDVALGEVPAWGKEMKKLRDLAVKHDKVVEKAIAEFARPSKKAFDGGLKALRESFLSARYDELRTALERAAADLPKGVKDGDVAQLQALLSERAAADDDGRAAAAICDQQQVEAFRAAHVEWFAGAGDEPAGD